MRTAGLLLLSNLLLSLSANSLAAQSLAELARESRRDRKAQNGKPDKVYTNDDLAESSASAVAVPQEKGAGGVDVTYQGFYNRTNNDTTANVGGAAISLLQFFPERGLFSLRLEPIANRGSFAAGENYAQWKGLPWKGRHWDFALGDFHINTALQPMPFTNLVQPDIYLRGGNVTVRTANWRYSFYAGLETLSQGPRIPFRQIVPQTAIGVETAGEISKRLQVGFRYLHLTSSGNDLSKASALFPLSRRFTRSDSLTSLATLKLTKSLEWYAEAGWNSAKEATSPAARNSSFSLVTGPAWNSPHVVVHANYVREGASYLPLLGYFLGDRAGTNIDGVFQFGRLALSGSLGQSRNNLERDPAATDFASRQESAGLQLRLPLSFSISASVSKIGLLTYSAATGPQPGESRQLNFSLSHPFSRQNVRATFQQLDTLSHGSVERLRLLELEDTYHWRRFTVGGAVRWQHTVAGERKDSMFFRGSAQVQLRRFSLYTYIEQGKDLANSTLFATNAISTSVAGISWDAPHGIAVQIEALRNNSNTVLNPESLFVLGSQGVPLNSILGRLNNWSIYIRATQHFGWGKRLAVDARGEVLRQAPLTGSLRGFVKFQTMEGEFGAPDVYLVLDSGVAVKTDAFGYFEIQKISEGHHSIALDLDRLPADFNPADRAESSVVLFPEKTTRVEFHLVPLLTLAGIVEQVNGNPAPEGVVVRLSPGDRYTTTDQAGRFGFYNLPEGDYLVQVDENSLPESARLVSPDRQPVMIRYGSAAAPVQFRYEVVLPGPKPIKTIFTDRLRADLAPGTAWGPR